MAILSRRLILLAILLYESFIHYTQINSSPNTQFLSIQQHAYRSFLVISWFDSVCVAVAWWVNVGQKCLHEHDNGNPTTMYESVFAQIYLFLVENIIYKFCLNCFHGR